MSPARLLRWSGLASIVAGVLLPLSEILATALGLRGDDFAGAALRPSYVPLVTLQLVGLVLLLLALPGLYVRQAGPAGTLGFVGFLVAFVGVSLGVGATWTDAFVPPAVAAGAPALLQGEPPPPLLTAFMVTFTVLPVGLALFGVATLLARVLPRWGAVLLIVGAAVDLVETLADAALPLSPGQVLIGAGLIWLGYALWTRVEDPVAGRPAPRETAP